MARAPRRKIRLGRLALVAALAVGCAEPVVTSPPPKTPPAVADAAVDKPSKAVYDSSFALPGSPDGGDGATPIADNQCGASGAGSAEPPRCEDFGVTIDPYYRDRYTCFYLGSVPGVPESKYGGLTLTQDRCSTTLLIGGDANAVEGMLYSIKVSRDGRGHINGFVGQATAHIKAPHNDGGVVYGPGGVLFLARWPANELQQTKPGSLLDDKVTDLAALGVAHSSAGLGFVPMGLPGAGKFKLVSWSGGQWYDVGYKPDASGTYDITAVTPVKAPGGAGDLRLPGGPEGFVYVAAGSPQFPVHGMLVSEWTGNSVVTYEIDAAGDPKLGTRRPFITGFMGAEGAFRDPSTGDFFFSTWQGGAEADRVIVVRGFAPIVVN